MLHREGRDQGQPLSYFYFAISQQRRSANQGAHPRRGESDGDELRKAAGVCSPEARTEVMGRNIDATSKGFGLLKRPLSILGRFGGA
jgi:hypothetical protein